MANCGNCSVELRFGNTPVLGGGRLASGDIICLDCFRQVLKLNSTVNVKKLTLTEIIAMLSNAQGNKDRIQLQLEAIGITKAATPAIWGRKEIAELGAIIADNEEMFGLVQGTYNNGQGILVATNKRLIFVDKGLIYGLKVEDFGLDKVSSIQYETGIIFADIKIMASGNTAKIEYVEKGAARSFCEKVRTKLSEPKPNVAPVTIVQSHLDVADQLAKLAKLKDQGILTQDEFDAQKMKLLNL